MLTKEEREAIAERAKKFDFSDQDVVYEVLVGNEIPDDTTFSTDIKAVRARIIDLCDTSNMVELPLDKDGEVIHVGDIVYYGSTIYMVKKIIYNGNEWKIQFFDDKLCISIYAEPNDLTRKKPVTIASLVEQIRRTLSQNTIMNKEATSKLWEITDQIEMLGDSDD